MSAADKRSSASYTRAANAYWSHWSADAALRRCPRPAEPPSCFPPPITGRITGLHLLLDRTPPAGIVLIPRDGLLKPLFDAVLLPPAQLLDLGTIQTIPEIVPGAVLDKFDRRLVLAHEFQDKACQFHVRQLLFACDIISFTINAALNEQINGAAMVFHEQPVPDLLTFPVNRDMLAIDQIGDE